MISIKNIQSVIQPLVHDYKAEGDFSTMMRESRVRKNPNYDAVCIRVKSLIMKMR